MAGTDSLAVVLDLRADAISNTIIDQLLLFLNAYLALHPGNRLAVFAGSHLVFPSRNHSIANSVSSIYHPFSRLQDCITNGIQAILDGSYSAASFGLARSLSTALCYLNKTHHVHNQNDAETRGRILVLSGYPEPPSHHVSLMNCIFSAQKASIPIDACQLLGNASFVFLQQAAFITRGAYLLIEKPEYLLSNLLSNCLVDTESRSHVKILQSLQVDFRAACFCHKRIIDTGCTFAVFCEPKEVCMVCGIPCQQNNGEPK